MGTARSKAKRQSKFMIFIGAPFRILIKARDFYVKSMVNCAGRVGNGGAVICPAASISHLPKSFSVASSNSSSKELWEHIRTASERGRGSTAGFDMCRQPKMGQPVALGCDGVGRSYSVGIGRMGRIEEDKPCDFVEETDLLYPRTRSYAVRKRNAVYY